MTELVAENAISPFQAILWCFYPVGAIVFVELFLRAMNGDDDDDDEGGGVMTPEAERFNGWSAMIGFVAAVGAYATTGQIIPGIF